MKKSILMLIALFMLGACSTFCDFSTPDDTPTVETPEGTESTEGTEEMFVIKLDELSADPKYSHFDVTAEDSNNWTYTADGVTYTFKESTSSDEATFSYEGGYGIIYSVAVTLDEDIAITKEDNVAEVYLGIASNSEASGHNKRVNGSYTEYKANLEDDGKTLVINNTRYFKIDESSAEYIEDYDEGFEDTAVPVITVIYADEEGYHECILYLESNVVYRTTSTALDI